MGKRDYCELIAVREGAGFNLCVGFDPDRPKVPKRYFGKLCHPFAAFGCQTVEATAESALAFKPNIAFFEPEGAEGWRALREVITYMHQRSPEIPVILDCKRADIGNTNKGYSEAMFDYFNADAVTVNPYFGAGAMKPFWERKDKGVIVLVRTSNPEAAEMQDVLMADGKPYYTRVARLVSEKWNVNGNCSMVVGATPGCLEPLELVRQIDGEIPILLPGLGTQGGEVEEAFPRAANKEGKRVIANVSRAILYADIEGLSHPESMAKVAKSFHDRLAACRKQIAG